MSWYRNSEMDKNFLFPAINTTTTNSGNTPNKCKRLLLLSAVFAFSVGLTIGLLIAFVYLNSNKEPAVRMVRPDFESNSSVIRTVFVDNSYANVNYPTVSFLNRDESGKNSNGSIVSGGVYWGDAVEKRLPPGVRDSKVWAGYLKRAVAVKLELGCGRMQNRLVTFADGLKGCVRYRQNTDQIQGELFSFYLAQILKLPNLAPSAVSVVDLKSPLWGGLGNEIAQAQWNSNKPVVLTQFIPDLGAAHIPPPFKPLDRHLNKYDVLNMTSNEISSDDDLLRKYVELAQWSDLIIFDYLTANLDRIVNNLYNYQWNVNIMDAPAHNLAKKSDNDLLIFLDNESGLLHGYRLLKKYEIYHSILLENLCMFRKSTARAVKFLKRSGNIGALLKTMFDNGNGDEVKDILPTLPDKSVKILNERIDKVYEQIVKCEDLYASADT